MEVVSVAQASEDTFELTDGHLLDSFLLPTHPETVPDESRPNLMLILIGLLGAAAMAFVLLRGMNR